MIYPRTLHVGFNPIGSPTNTGLTLGSMFGAWPESQLLELYTVSRENRVHGRPNVLLAPRRSAPIDGLIRVVLGSRVPSPASDGMNNSVSGRAAALPLRYRIWAAAATLNEVGPVSVAGRWTEPISQFQPQVIHSLLGGVRVAKLVARLAERLSVPVVPHFMDDWPANMFADGKLLGLPRAEVERSMAAVLRRAPLCLTIGEDMRREFEQRLEKPCHVVGNSVNFEAFDVAKSAAAGRRTFTYVGGLHLGRDVVLGRVAAALMRSGSGRLVIHAPRSDDARLAALARQFPSVVDSGGTVAPEAVPRALGGADVLVFVESLAPEIYSFTRLSVSTKVPEYLASGKPILAIGPEGQSSIRCLTSGPATSHCAGDVDSEVAAAVERALGLASQPVPPLSNRLRQSFDRIDTQERLRSALALAAGWEN